MRYLYNLLLYLAFPYLLLHLWRRSRRLPAYRERILERFGYYPFSLKNCIWVHAVSVGEVMAAIPLIKALQSHYPTQPLLVTTMTPTGALRVRAVFGETVSHGYLPYDYPQAVQRFLNHMRPCVGIIVETELWPNLIDACQQQRIPLCLVNARLSAKSQRSYARVASLTRKMLQSLTLIAASGASDADRLIALGAPKDRVHVMGNIKFDLELPADLSAQSATLRNLLGRERAIWIAASTHEGEEAMILAAHKKWREQNPQALLILVPRHPDRFEQVAALCIQQGLVTARRSQHQSCTAETAVYLGDTMGELLLMYEVADVAFVGGSLVERGGHNMLEPAALGKSILVGPSYFNFTEIRQLLFSAEALCEITDVASLMKALDHLMQDTKARAAMGKRAYEVVAANRGALAKQVHAVLTVLDKNISN